MYWGPHRLMHHHGHARTRSQPFLAADENWDIHGWIWDEAYTWTFIDRSGCVDPNVHCPGVSWVPDTKPTFAHNTAFCDRPPQLPVELDWWVAIVVHGWLGCACSSSRPVSTVRTTTGNCKSSSASLLHAFRNQNCDHKSSVSSPFHY